MTVSKLRTELSDAELVHFAAYYQLKGEEEKKDEGVVAITAAPATSVETESPDVDVAAPSGPASVEKREKRLTARQT